MGDKARLGGKVRALRRREGLTQARLAQKLGISASYLNLIEHDKRPLSAAVLIKLAQVFDIDLRTFAGDDDARLTADLMEVLSDPMFEDQALSNQEVKDMVGSSPAMARAVLGLYEAYRGAADRARVLASQLADGDPAEGALRRPDLPSEEVHDLIQDHQNHFPDLEAGAEALLREARLDPNELSNGLIRYVEEVLRVDVRIVRASAEARAVRRYDPDHKVLFLSEVLRPRSRIFQLAHQIALITQARTLDKLTRDPVLTSDASRALARVALANYFAGAIIMPYDRVLQAAVENRYDVELLGHRFRVGWEQVCHRLTTLRRPGSEGVPFHLIRIDLAGNISKHFSASGVRFPRFSGLCPKWAVHAAFLTPDLVRTQVSQMPDGTAYFSVARTIRKGERGFHSPDIVQAIELGCPIEHAAELVYADGVNLDKAQAAIPIGVSCRLCERMDCEQRAVPSLHTPLDIDTNVRGLTFYMGTD